MLVKILYTLLVIVGVAFFFRNKTNATPKIQPSDQPALIEDPNAKRKSLSTKTITYLLVAVLVAISTMIFVINYNSQNRIVNIRVISESGSTMNYQARHKTIKGRIFVTLDGKQVTLGESDRIEMLEQ